MVKLVAYRVYASTRSSIENLPYTNLDQEMHIVLAFARDYDSCGNHTTGNFIPYFDTSNIDAETIRAIRNEPSYTSIKFLLSIGGRDSRFPFAVTNAQASAWIINATESLKQIVMDYGFDGIDVYYEHIDYTAESYFAKLMFQVISNLKYEEKVISESSITVSAPLSDSYYDLFSQNEKLFDYVVYQTHTGAVRISDPKDLEAVFDTLPYPKEKILAGHSDVLPSDWAKVPPPVFLGAVPQLLDKELFGISKWIVTPNDHNPEA